MKRTLLAFFSLLAILLSVSPLSAQTPSEQYTITGRVTSHDSDDPIPGAHVYLANTSIGDITDANGSFQFTSTDPGIYQLVVTSIGFKSFQKEILLNDTFLLPFKIAIAEAVYEAGELTVSEKRPTLGQRMRWKLDLAAFKRMFLGTTSNRADCKILNEKVLKLERIHGQLRVWSTEPLRIRNGSLGYEIHYSLNEFQANDGVFKFRGEPFFQELSPKNEKEYNKWLQKRDDTYLGSFQHFLRSLAELEVQEDGFKLYLLPMTLADNEEQDLIDAVEIYNSEIALSFDPNKIPIDSVVVPSQNSFERTFVFQDFLHVVYEPKTLPEKYYEDKGLPDRYPGEHERSVLKLNASSVSFNVKGFTNHPYDITRQGYWGWQAGICNWLPFNY